MRWYGIVPISCAVVAQADLVAVQGPSHTTKAFRSLIRLSSRSPTIAVLLGVVGETPLLLVWGSVVREHDSI